MVCKYRVGPEYSIAFELDEWVDEVYFYIKTHIPDNYKVVNEDDGIFICIHPPFTQQIMTLLASKYQMIQENLDYEGLFGGKDDIQDVVDKINEDWLREGNSLFDDFEEAQEVNYEDLLREERERRERERRRKQKSTFDNEAERFRFHARQNFGDPEEPMNWQDQFKKKAQEQGFRIHIPMQEETGPYSVLFLRQGAPFHVVQAVYRHLAKMYHPDKNIGKDTTEQMKTFTVAFNEIKRIEKGRKDGKEEVNT